KRQAPIVLMHMQGTPATMQGNPTYADGVAGGFAFLGKRNAPPRAAGIAPPRLPLAPRIWVRQAKAPNTALRRGPRAFTRLGKPMVVGVSRKGFIGRLSGETEPSERLFGTAAAVAWSVANGASIVRVHDVPEMSKVVRVIDAIQNPADFLTS